MTVELKPEAERLVQEELHRGNFHSLDELIVQGVQAWREKNQAMPVISKPPKRIYDLLTQPPFAGSNVITERPKEYPRLVDLG